MRDIRTATITSKGQIVIPNALRAQNGFQSGQKVALLAFADHLEVRPLQAVLAKIDFDTERKKTRQAVQQFAAKHKLKNQSIKELTKKQRNKLAKAFLG